MKSVVFTFGRMNPPTTGHQLLVNKLVAYARQIGAAPRVYLSHSTGKKDPLQYDKKISFARQAFGAIVKKSNARNVIQILQSLEKEGYKHVIMFAGSDRVPEFTKLLNAYNGKEYKFDKIEVKSAGERDPDADDVSGMSASKMRALAADDKVAEFMRGAPSTLKAQTRKQMFLAVRKVLLGEDVMEYSHDEMFVQFVIESSNEDAIELPSDGEITKMIDKLDITDLDLDDADAVMLDLLIGKEDKEEDDKEDVKEARILSGAARQKLAQRMKSMSKRLARLRQIKAKQMPAQQRLRLRARKAALMILRKRATGKKNLDYNSLSRSQRIAVDTALVQRFGNRLNKAVDVLSKRILPKIRSKAQQNVAKARDMKKENVNELFTSNPHLLGKEKEGSAKDRAQDKLQAAKRGISVADWEKTKADAAHDSPLNVDATKLNTLDTDPSLNDRTAPNPKQAHLNLNRKLMHYARSVDEARRGASAETGDPGDTNIIYQMRKVVLARGNHDVAFADGSKHKISVNDANKLIDKFNSIRMPKEKQLFTIAAGKSLKGFRETLLHGAPQEVGKKVSLGGRTFKEFYMGSFGRNRTIAPYPQDSDEPPGTRRVAEKKIVKEASVGGVDKDANDDPNKPRKTNAKLDLLLRLGLADTDELQKYRRALRTSKKQALQSPEMRKKLADLLDKLIDLTTQDPAIYSRARTKIVTTKEAYALLRKSEMSGIDANVIAEVYVRGLNESGESTVAFDRVNSFIAGGAAAQIDSDLLEDGKGYKSPSGGLTQKGRDYYNRKNGSNLKAPVTKKPSELKRGGKAAGRRASFCARMGGMKKRLTSAKTARDPNSRINKALRKWNCRSEDTQIVEKRGLWDNIHAKRARIKAGSGEKMRKPGSKGAPSNADLKASQNENAPCWSNYKQIGMKMKGGRQVPNCVPKEAVSPAQQRAAGAALATQRGEYAGGKKGGAINRMAMIEPKKLRQIAKKKTNENHQVVATSKTGETFKSAIYQHKKKAQDMHYKMAKSGNYKKVDIVKAKVKEEVEQIDEISSGLLKRAMHKAGNRAMWLSSAGKNNPAFKKEKERANKFRTAGIAKEKKEKAKMNEMFEQLSTHKATSLSQRTKRTKPFRAWEPPAHTDHSSLSGKNEATRRSDVKMVKVKLPDGKVVFRRERPKTEVQMEQGHKHPTGRTPYSDLTNKELRADLTKKVKAASEAYTGSEPTSSNKNDPSNRFVGTDAIVKNYAAATPGQSTKIETASFATAKPFVASSRDDEDAGAARVQANQTDPSAAKHFKDIKKALAGIRESNDLNESFAAGFELAPFARDYGIQIQSSFQHDPSVQEQLDAQNEATYQGKTVPLNKPMKGDVKKSKVYVDPDGDGKAQKVNFGDKKLSIKKGIPARKKSYCARSSGQGNLTDKTKANYWSRRAWDC